MSAGFTLHEMKRGGYAAKECGYAAQEVFDMGFCDQEAKNGGCGEELRNAGKELKDVFDAGFDDKEGKDAGHSAAEFRISGQDMWQAMPAGVTRGGYTAKECGYTLQEVFDMGFSDQEAKDGGYSA